MGVTVGRGEVGSAVCSCRSRRVGYVAELSVAFANRRLLTRGVRRQLHTRAVAAKNKRTRERAIESYPSSDNARGSKRATRWTRGAMLPPR